MEGLVSRLTDIEGASEGGSCCFGFPGSVSAEDRADCEFFEPFTAAVLSHISGLLSVGAIYHLDFYWPYLISGRLAVGFDINPGDSICTSNKCDDVIHVSQSVGSPRNLLDNMNQRYLRVFLRSI